jgi:hypothetical protein
VRDAKKTRKLDLEVISYPEDVLITDPYFVIFAEVRNIGTLPLENVVLDIDSVKGWYGERMHIGRLETGERKVVEIRVDNNICASDKFVLASPLHIGLTAWDEGASDHEDVYTNSEIPLVSILTDRDAYAEGDVMRACIIFNNLDGADQDKLEFELGVSYGEYYVVDYLSPYAVSGGKVLVVTKDYPLDSIPVTGDYRIDVSAYKDGALFSDSYCSAEASTTVFLNGFIEQRLLQAENSVHPFFYENEQHSLKLTWLDESFVDVIVSSYANEYRVRLLETEEVDLDSDSLPDVSLTYVGTLAGRADLRLRLLPKHPPRMSQSSVYYVLDLDRDEAESHRICYVQMGCLPDDRSIADCYSEGVPAALSKNNSGDHESGEKGRDYCQAREGACSKRDFKNCGVVRCIYFKAQPTTNNETYRKMMFKRC